MILCDFQHHLDLGHPRMAPDTLRYISLSTQQLEIDILLLLLHVTSEWSTTHFGPESYGLLGLLEAQWRHLSWANSVNFLLDNISRKDQKDIHLKSYGGNRVKYKQSSEVSSC